MQAVELVKVAAAAEILHMKRYGRRQGIRVGFTVGAVFFLLTMFAMIHVLLVVLLTIVVHLWLAVLIVLVIDLVVGGILGSLALRNTPDRIEREAVVIRRQSLAEAESAATSLATMGQVAALALGMVGRHSAKSSPVGKARMISDLASRFVRR